MRQPAKKKGAAKKMGDEAKLREEFTNKGPLRLRKYAITGLNIPAEVVDNWNDFNYMVDYCVAKALGQDTPEPEEGEENSYDESSTEFDASGMVGDDDEGGDGFDDEMEEGGGGMFADPDETPDPEPEPEPEAPKEPKPAKKRQPRKKKAPAPPAEAGDINVQLQGMLDVITNQGAVLDQLASDTKLVKSTVEEVYVRQQASHKAISVIAKTLFKVSTFVSEYVPRALKAMKYKPAVTKDLKAKAEAASKDAEQLIAGLLDPEAD